MEKDDKRDLEESEKEDDDDDREEGEDGEEGGRGEEGMRAQPQCVRQDTKNKCWIKMYSSTLMPMLSWSMTLSAPLSLTLSQTFKV